MKIPPIPDFQLNTLGHRNLPYHGHTNVEVDQKGMNHFNFWFMLHALWQFICYTYAQS